MVFAFFKEFSKSSIFKILQLIKICNKRVCPIPPAPYGPTTPGFTPAITSPPAPAPKTSLSPVEALELYICCLSASIFCTPTSNMLKNFMSERCLYVISAPMFLYPPSVAG